MGGMCLLDQLVQYVCKGIKHKLLTNYGCISLRKLHELVIKDV